MGIYLRRWHVKVASQKLLCHDANDEVSKCLYKSETKKTTSTSTERQKRSQNLAPVLVIISGNSLVFSRKLLPVLVFTGTAPPARQHQ